LKLTRKSHRSNSSLADVFTAFLWSKIGDGMAGVLQNLRENDHGDRSRMTNGQWLRDLLGGCYIGCYISGYGLSISIIEFPWMGWVPYVDICSQMFYNLYTNIYIYIIQIDIWMHIFLADAHQLYVVPRCYGSVGVFSCGSYGTLVALALEGLESRQRCEHVEMMMWVNHFAFNFWVVKFLQISVITQFMFMLFVFSLPCFSVDLFFQMRIKSAGPSHSIMSKWRFP
jgi:hypothetical protein